MHHGVQKFGSDSACRLPFLHHYKSDGVSLLRSSCPRVVLPIIFSRLVVADMGVYLGCSDLGMPQKILNDTKVGPSLVQVRGEAVPQPVGCQLRYAAGLRPLLDPLPEGRVAERSSPVV